MQEEREIPADSLNEILDGCEDARQALKDIERSGVDVSEACKLLKNFESEIEYLLADFE